MKQISFVATISYYWQQQWCWWATRLTPILVGLILSSLVYCSYRWYQLHTVRHQVQLLAQGLVNFERDVRAKQDLVAEQGRLAAHLARLQRENHAAVVQQLIEQLTMVATVIPLRLYLTQFELTPGRQLVLTGLSPKPALIVQFWQKLLSLPQFLDGKLINQTTASDAKLANKQHAFQITLNLANTDYAQDSATISS